MFENVIVGFDDRDGGRDAIALATRLREPGGRLTLAYVYLGEAHAWRGSCAAYDVVERERGHELLRLARAQAGIAADLRVVGSPSVGRGLHELAEATDADLLVVGSSRRGLLGRVLMGDDTRSALNTAPCAVAIAPAGYTLQPAHMREIGVAYNGSPESERALEVARALAARYDTRLSAFEAVTLRAYVFAEGAGPLGDTIAELIESARERVASLPGVEPHAAYGVPAEELTLYSASLDLLIVGSRGYGPLGRLVHGSTSRQLARTARCPLLVLTRAASLANPDQQNENTGKLTAGTEAR